MFCTSGKEDEVDTVLATEERHINYSNETDASVIKVSEQMCSDTVEGRLGFSCTVMISALSNSLVFQKFH